MTPQQLQRFVEDLRAQRELCNQGMDQAVDSFHQLNRVLAKLNVLISQAKKRLQAAIDQQQANDDADWWKSA